MDFEKVEKFLRDHWPAGLMTAILIVPTTIGVAVFYFNDRVSELEKRVLELKTQAADLEKKAEKHEKRAFELSELVEKLTAEKLAARKNDPVKPVSLDFDRLYTPSNAIKTGN